MSLLSCNYCITGYPKPADTRIIKDITYYVLCEAGVDMAVVSSRIDRFSKGHLRFDSPSPLKRKVVAM